MDIYRMGRLVWGGLLGLALAGCAGTPDQSESFPQTVDDTSYEYIIGAGDALNIFVWRNPDVSMTGVPVRPDGRVSSPLVEDLVAAGKTANQLGRDVEAALGKYIKDPLVTVTVTNFVGGYSEQVRVVGEAAAPRALPYRNRMSLLDVMIAVGGLTEFADGNKARLVRNVEGQTAETTVRLEDLIKGGDISANLPMFPGDVLIIPEAWF